MDTKAKSMDTKAKSTEENGAQEIIVKRIRERVDTLLAGAS
jgi:hypothetical protein